MTNESCPKTSIEQQPKHKAFGGFLIGLWIMMTFFISPGATYASVNLEFRKQHSDHADYLLQSQTSKLQHNFSDLFIEEFEEDIDEDESSNCSSVSAFTNSKPLYQSLIFFSGFKNQTNLLVKNIPQYVWHHSWKFHLIS